ncbi:UNVERIFIED_CONTAM: hypothetical protein K2H54_067606 [Gekko kuhli]
MSYPSRRQSLTIDPRDFERHPARGHHRIAESWVLRQSSCLTLQACRRGAHIGKRVPSPSQPFGVYLENEPRGQTEAM